LALLKFLNFTANLTLLQQYSTNEHYSHSVTIQDGLNIAPEQQQKGSIASYQTSQATVHGDHDVSAK
jgi:hypothetical protein